MHRNPSFVSYAIHSWTTTDTRSTNSSWDPNNGSILSSPDGGNTWSSYALPFKVGGNMPGRLVETRNLREKYPITDVQISFSVVLGSVLPLTRTSQASSISALVAGTVCGRVPTAAPLGPRLQPSPASGRMFKIRRARTLLTPL